MRKMMFVLLVVLVLSMLTATAAFADTPLTTDGFICPVAGGRAGEQGQHNGLTFIESTGGDFYTVLGPDVHVPVHATNANGAGTPPGDHASPGNTNYTAIWAYQ